MTIKETFEQAIAVARSKAQASGYDFRVVEVAGGFAVGTMKQICFHYPEAPGWNVRHQMQTTR